MTDHNLPAIIVSILLRVEGGVGFGGWLNAEVIVCLQKTVTHPSASLMLIVSTRMCGSSIHARNSSNVQQALEQRAPGPLPARPLF